MRVSYFWADLPDELRKEDKLKHIALSFLLLLAALMWWSLPTALAVVFLIGLAKEIWDKYFGSGFCFYDLLGNCIGMGLALVIGVPIRLALS